MSCKECQTCRTCQHHLDLEDFTGMLEWTSVLADQAQVGYAMRADKGKAVSTPLRVATPELMPDSGHSELLAQPLESKPAVTTQPSFHNCL